MTLLTFCSTSYFTRLKPATSVSRRPNFQVTGILSTMSNPLSMRKESRSLSAHNSKRRPQHVAELIFIVLLQLTENVTRVRHHTISPSKKADFPLAMSRFETGPQTPGNSCGRRSLGAPTLNRAIAKENDSLFRSSCKKLYRRIG